MFSTTVAAVFPAFNEQANLANVINEAEQILSGFFSDHRIVIVNDGSADRTGRIADSLAAANGRIVVVHHPLNQGYGAAVRSGFGEALTTGMEWVFFTDTDGQFDFSQIIQFMVQAQQTGDKLVIGYRTKRADSLTRRINGWGWTRINRMLLGIGAKDLDCAFKLIHSRVLNEIGSLQGDAATINPELLHKAKCLGYSFIQLPVIHRPRLAGTQTGASLRVIIKSFASLFRLWEQSRQTQEFTGRP